MTKKLKLIDFLLLLAELLLSGLLLYLVKNMLPNKYLAIAGGLLIILLFLIFLGLKGTKRGFLKTLIRFICLILCFALGVGTLYISKGFTVLNDITDGRYETTVLSLVVKGDSDFESIEDLNEHNIGISSAINQASMEDITSKLSQKISFNTTLYDKLDEMVACLYDDGEDAIEDAIIINEGLRGMIEELYPTFSQDTRVIYTSQTVKEIEISKKDTFDITKDTFNICISGIDTYGPVSTVSRSDVNMIVTINPSTKQILMTSIPRDYYVTLHSYGAYDKLTHAGIYGVQESLSTLEDLFDIDIAYYAKVNFSSLITIVDALDGITVNNPNEFVSALGYYFPEGNINLDGQEALAFSRERYSFSGGDRERVKNQQRVLTGIINKLISPTIITNYSSILNAISGCFQTNISSEDIQKLIAMQLNDMASWSIEQISVDGYGDTSWDCFSMPGPGLYVMIPYDNTVQEATSKINAMKNN